MKICLLIPPARSAGRVPERVYGCTFTYYKQPELPMLYVASVLENDGHAVELRDFTDTNSWDEFTGFVRGARYDVYIFHTVLLAETIDLNAARYVLENTDSRVIFFGPHPTLKPREFLVNDRCFVARGEAEFIIRDILRGLEGGGPQRVRGLSCINKGEMVETESYGIIEDLDALPFPARHLIGDRKRDYFNPKLHTRPVALILTSRGCGFRCYYCVPNAISWARELEWRRFHDGRKPPVRFRSPGDIINEFKEVREQGYRAVSVVDDLFLLGGKKRILEICGGLEGVGLEFGVLARCDLVVDEETVGALKRAGCRYVDLGIESLDQRVLDDIEKGMDVSSVEKAVGLLNRYGIEPKANIMFGASPVETRRSVEETIDGVRRLPINYCMFSIATPFPGTEFDRRVREEGWAVEPEINDLEQNLSPTEKALVSYPELTKDDLERAVKRANRRFYLTPRRIVHQLGRAWSLKRLKEILVMGWRVIR